MKIAILLTLFMLVPKSLASVQCKGLSNLSPLQDITLRESYHHGYDEDFGLTLAAIAWQESSAGLFLINVGGPSFGVHQILLTSAAKRAGAHTEFEKNILATKLLKHDVSAEYAMKELRFWRKVHGKDYMRIWASYYAGYNYDEKSGRDYANKIRQKVTILKECMGW